jgi:hypothetical protein
MLSSVTFGALDCGIWASFFIVHPAAPMDSRVTIAMFFIFMAGYPDFNTQMEGYQKNLTMRMIISA